MAETRAELFFCGCNFPVPRETLYQALVDDASWEQDLGGTPMNREQDDCIRLNHGASGGVIEVAFDPKDHGSRLNVALYAESLDRASLDQFSRRTSALFEALEGKLGALPGNLVPEAWPAVHAAPGTAPRVLRRADYAWKTARYSDAPDDTMGEMAPLTRPLGVSQFGADVHRLNPGERNCRNHVEIHEQEGFLVLSGTCHIEVEGQVVKLETGDFCVTFPGEEHHFFNAGDAPCEVLAFGGPNLGASGSSYPKGRDFGWRERLGAYYNGA